MRPAELVVGNCYFSVGYQDRDLLVPSIQTILYVGTEHDPDDDRRLWLFREPQATVPDAGENGADEEAALWAFPDEQLHTILDLAGLRGVLEELAIEHPLLPPPPARGPASRADLAELRTRALQFLDGSDVEGLTATILFTDDGLSLTRRDDGNIDLLLVPHPRRQPGREEQLRAACAVAGLVAAEDYLCDRGRTRILTYPISNMDPAGLVELLIRIILDVYAMREDDVLTYSVRMKQAQGDLSSS